MATSISKAQADALSSGFLDTLGSNEEFTPFNSLSALYQVAGILLQEAQENLNRVDRNSSGALSESMKILSPELVGKSIRLDIEALFYYKFVNLGVKGLKQGNGRYAFRYPGVSVKMMLAIRKWVIKEGLKAITNRKYSGITNREIKRKSIKDTSTRAAYMIARSIKQHGLRPTNFFTDAVITAQQASKDLLGAGLKLDVIQTLPKNLNGNNNSI